LALKGRVISKPRPVQRTRLRLIFPDSNDFFSLLALREGPAKAGLFLWIYLRWENIHSRKSGSAKALSQLLWFTPGYSVYLTLTRRSSSFFTMAREQDTLTTPSSVPWKTQKGSLTRV